MTTLELLASYWLAIDEPLGAVLGLVIVLCLIRQNLWAWPLGVLYVFVSVTVLWEARLYANLLLHVAGFLPMNLYGWYYWIHGRQADADELPVTRATPRMLSAMAVVCVAATALLGFYFARYSDAALPFWDNGVLVASLAAMWLTARKKIENWILWFAVDVVSVGLYYAQGLGWYSALYFLYLGMAVAGYLAWKRTMTAMPAPAEVR